MNNNNLKDKWFRIIGFPLLTLVLLLLSNDPMSDLSFRIILLKTIKNLLYIALYWESNRLILSYLRNKYPLLKDTAKRLGVQALMFLAFITFGSALLTTINYSLPLDEDDVVFWAEYKNAFLKGMILLGLVTVIYECAYFFGLYEKTLYESEKLKKEGLISQFELLKNQISPHFLFNSLNALITLIPDDPKLSVMFVQRLSSVYRNVLNANEKNLVSLEKELEFLEDYIFLYQMRFGENLLIHYDTAVRLEDLEVVPFTLQMLVENAIKHNIISNRKPLKITISVQDDFIVVNNNLQRKTSGVESTNTGLKNIISRYQLITNKLVDIKVTATDFRVALPLIFNKNQL